MSTESKRFKVPFWLFLSGLVNLILAGFIAGYLLRPGLDRPRHDRHDRAHFEDMRVLGELMRDSREAAGPQVEAHRAAQAELIEALRKEPFDEALVRGRFAAVRSTDTEMKSALDAALIPKLAALPPEERARLAEAISQGRDRRHRRRDRRGEDATPPK